MAFPSKYPGRCPDCKFPIFKGEMIVRKNGKYVHEVCPNGSSKSKMDLGSAIRQAEANSMQDGESVSVAPANFVPSKYQQAVFDFIKNEKGNAVVEAVAGSGKTTTIVQALSYTSPTDRVGFFAFNKHIADELKRRQNLGQIPEHVHVSTLHSLGRSIIMKLEDKPEVERDKVSMIMDVFWPVSRKSGVDPLTRRKNKELRGKMRKTVSLAKATLIDFEDQNTVLEMSERYGLEIEDRDSYEVVVKLPEVMKACKDDLTTIDFDDMIWLPLVNERLKRHFEKFDILFVDECQDLNKAQIEFVLNSLQPKTGRIIAVGDRKQSLYGFRGADTEAIPRMIEMLHAKTLPLSISYRNPKAIVEEAKKLVPQIEAWEKAEEGEILTIKYPEFMNCVKVGDMVVCRTNAPLVQPAFTMIKRGVKAIIRGQDIGENLINFVERFNTDDLMQLEGLMREWTEREHSRLIEKGKELAAEMVLDKHEVIMGIAQQSRTVMDLVEKLRMMFSDKVEGVVFSSVHRAKGLEAKNIYVLHKELMPHPKANMESWEGEQEWNCLYVAITRSKSRLIWVLED